MPRTDDRDPLLMARVGRGDREALAELYARHAPAVHRLLVHLTGDVQHAEDLTQEVFVRAWQAAPRWRPEAPVLAWLRRIARNAGWNALAFAHRRRHLRRDGRAAALDAVERAVGDVPDAARRLADLEGAARVRAALAALSPPLRWVFVLVRLEGTSLAEAAEATDVPLGTIKSRLAAAERWLRERLLEPGA